MLARRWLPICAMVCAVSLAAAPPAPGPVELPPQRGAAPAADPPQPDDDIIEFLGADDVGDTAWWEFLRKSEPRQVATPGQRPQEAAHD